MSQERLLENPIVKELAEAYKAAGDLSWNEFILKKKVWPYTILAFRSKKYGTIWSKNSEGKFDNSSNSTVSPEHWFLTDYAKDYYEIYSVRRNSDGIIFTIDNRISTDTSHSIVVKGFIINSGDMIIRTSLGSVRMGLASKAVSILTTYEGIAKYVGDKIYILQKTFGKVEWYGSKEVPLIVHASTTRPFNGLIDFHSLETAQAYYDRANPFIGTTEDGVNITSETVLLWIDANFSSISVPRLVSKDSYDYHVKMGQKAFSTSGARRDYIRRNKPVLSLADVEACHAVRFFNMDYIRHLVGERTKHI
jgi:hypothetical protein